MNTRMKTIFVATLLVTSLLSACGIGMRRGSGYFISDRQAVRGSGHVVSEPRAVSDFRAVNFNSLGKLTLVHGDTESLTIETDDNLLPYIKTAVSQGTLTIELGENGQDPLLRPTGEIRYMLTVKNLMAFDLSGAGMVESAGLTADQLTLRESGAGEIKINQLKVNQLAVEMSGAGTVDLTGQVMQQTVEMSGVGNYRAGGLKSQTAKVMLSGTGTATVWVQEELESELSGMGTINYYGSPQTHAAASGIGTLQSLGNKD